MLENDDKQESGGNDSGSSQQNQETHRDGIVTVVKTEN
tara:strand:- start:583 stop:696 length:114 start_codon:yes stop_codon:yes gene_type:complete